VKEFRKAAAVITLVLFLAAALPGCINIYTGKTPEEQPDDTSAQQQTQETPSGIQKKDPSQDWVYPTRYPDPAPLGDGYDVYPGCSPQYIDLAVPFINIDSPDADRLNALYRETWAEMMEVYNEGVRVSAAQDGIIVYVQTKYVTYTNDDVLSVVFVVGYAGSDVYYPQYIICNFSLTTGGLVGFDELCAMAGTDRESAIAGVDSSIYSWLDTYYADQQALHTYLELSKQNLRLGLTDSTAGYFLDSSGKLYVEFVMAYPAGRESRNVVLPVSWEGAEYLVPGWDPLY